MPLIPIRKQDKNKDMSRRSMRNDDVGWENRDISERDCDEIENENRCSGHDDSWDGGRNCSERESRRSNTRQRGVRTIHRGRDADREKSRPEIEHRSSHERERETSVNRRKEFANEVEPHSQIDQSKNSVGAKLSHRLNYEKKASKISINEMKEHSLPPTPRHSPIPVLSGVPTERRQMEARVESKLSFKKKRSYSILREEEDTVRRNASVLLPVLEDSERIFHEMVAAGDVHAIKMFLLDHPNFNINCVNYQKISALHGAVKQQNEAMVEFLLEQKALDVSDCALYAIKGGNIRIVEMILDKIREKSPGLEFAGTTHSVDFADDLTPLILAAQLGNYEMIDFLIKRDHSIPAVHPPFCKCEACKTDLKKYDRLRYSTMKLNLYKAICNPMYIFHTTDDPFQRAFELTKELQDAATVFPQFKVLFEELWMNLRSFTVDLIGCCRNSQEVEIVLKKSPKSVTNHIKFPRLQYAIDLKQKEFVSHPYTQAVLSDAWTGELLEWKIRSPLMQSLSVFPRIPMLPVMTIMCIFLPNHSLVRKWKTPVNKMISSVASYLIFLIILFLESNLDKCNQKRGPPNSGLEGAIIIYVIGYIWLNIRTCFKQGVKRFFSTMWHWYDTMMLFLFTMTIIFWIASWVDITANNDVDLPRKYWNSLDPELIAEGFFAAAVIMAFFRLNLFLSLNYHLGPLQVSIGKMTLDIFRFIIIFFIIILAWCAGLCRFYQPYEGMVQKDAASGTTTTQVSSFVSFLMTLKTFFWAIFGMSPIESADVIIENLPGDTPGTTIINKHQFTEAIGYIAFALFQFLSVVVVLNMLVACMANTFTKVIDNVTVEWVFGRSQIYLSFMASSVLPPPFNLVPTASGIKDMFRWFRLLAKSSDGQKAKCSLAHCCFIESETEPYVNNEFPSLMSELAQRYIRLKAEVQEEERNHDLDDLRSDVNDVKELLRKLNAAISNRTSK